MSILLLGLVGIGIGASVATLLHDLRRLRIGAVVPQAAPKRIAPEVHALGAGLTGVGCWLLWGWLIGLAAVVGQVVLAYLVAPPVLEALAFRATVRPPSR